MSRLAYIISAYKDAEQLNRLVCTLDCDADFYVHIDSRVDIRPFERLLKGKVTFVRRHWISWGGWEQVEYQKELLKAVIESGVEYGHVVCLSGQDYPLWNNEQIHRYFDEHLYTEFISGYNLTRCSDLAQRNKFVCYHFFRDLHWKNNWLKNKLIVVSRHLMRLLPFKKLPIVRLPDGACDVYFGSDYWALTLRCARHVYESLCYQPQWKQYFRTSFAPSELCIQTIVFNSPFAANALLCRNASFPGLAALTPLHYIDYGRCVKTLSLEDLPNLCECGKMFCRKLESGASDRLMARLPLM